MLGGLLLANGTAAARSSHRKPGTSIGVGRRRKALSVESAPMSATSIVAIIEPSSVDDDLAEKRELGRYFFLVTPRA
jgi:hypothetical protein